MGRRERIVTGVSVFLGLLALILTFVAMRGSDTVRVPPSPPAASPGTSTPVPTTPTESGGASNAGHASDELRQFIADCAKNINNWQRGDAVYPGTLAVKLNESVAYTAGIDLKSDLTFPEPGPGTSYSRVPIDVRCGLGAKLVSGSSDLEVDKTDWILENFDTPGELRWAWNIRGKKPGEYEVALQLRPAVAVKDGGYVVPAGESQSPTTTFITRVTVTADPLQELYSWWEENWPKIVPIATALGTAIVAVLAWLRKLRKGSEGGQQAGPGRTTGMSQTKRRKRRR